VYVCFVKFDPITKLTTETHEQLDRQIFCRQHMSSLRYTLISYVCWRNVLCDLWWLSARLPCPSTPTPFAWLCDLRCSTTYGDWYFVVVGQPN